MNIQVKRNQLSSRYIKGDGIEVGALHGPLEVNNIAQVKYVDRMSVKELRQHYPELGDLNLVEPDIIDDGEILSKITDGSLDFIIANHMLEHCENPIGTLRNHVAKLKPGGIGYYAVPDKNYTFDIERPLTTFEHLVYDDKLGVLGSREQDFREWVTYVNNKKGDDAVEYVKHLMEIDYSIHFHVWDYNAFCKFIEEANVYLGGLYRIEEIQKNSGEIICIIRRPYDGEIVERHSAVYMKESYKRSAIYDLFKRIIKSVKF